MDLDFDVVELGPTDHPTEGDQAPDFERPLVNEEFWEDRALSDLTADGPVVLVFHPMDGAFPATYVWNEIRDREGEHSEPSEKASGEERPASPGGLADIQVVGVSISTPYAHKRLIDERGIDYRLFSDPAASVAAEYDIENDLDGMAGITEHRPAVFVLDDERVIQYAWVAEEWPAFPPYDEVEAAIDAL